MHAAAAMPGQQGPTPISMPAFPRTIGSLAGLNIHPAFVDRVPIAFARDHSIIVMEDEGMVPLGVMADPAELRYVEMAGRLMGCAVAPRVLRPAEGDAAALVRAAIGSGYQKDQSGRIQAVISAFDRDEVLRGIQALGETEDLLDVSGRAPVIRLVNMMLFEAVRYSASDIHVQPEADAVAVRMRVDGVLEEIFRLPKTVQEEVVSRIKVMARMNIAEKRLPQDGRASAEVGDREVDLRIATLPTGHGERAVIRLLERDDRLLGLPELGMPPETATVMRRLISADHGIVLVTGPTGSGKTTTLYATLRELNSTEFNIVTIEDPIEYQLSGISQSQISERKGMTFASGLRSVLRQDPDIIMVGEIRDRETASMAIQSALTGHLVFSTLHTNDAPSAITRLLDLGVEPYLVASSVMGVVAQRLVRRLCRTCGGTGRVGGSHAATGVPAESCAACRGSGFKGRGGIFEVLLVNDDIRRLIIGRADAASIKAAAVGAGMRTLRDDGIVRVRQGETTLDEVDRVTNAPETA